MLTEHLARAVATGDLEAARITHDAIGQLLGASRPWIEVRSDLSALHHLGRNDREMLIARTAVRCRRR